MTGISEDQARGKWCPFARRNLTNPTTNSWGSNPGEGYGGGGGTGGRVSPQYEIDRDAKCIGSECMAWRWTQRTGTSVTIKPGETGILPTADLGCCGIAR